MSSKSRRRQNEKYISTIQMISPKGIEIDVISRQIANAHTGFNITMTLIWLPLIGILVKIVMKLVPEKRVDGILGTQDFKHLDSRLTNQPTAALHLVSKEVFRVGEIVENMLFYVKTNSEIDDETIYKEIIDKAEEEQRLSESIHEYLSQMFSEGVMTEKQAGAAARLSYVLCDIDRIGQLCKEITENVYLQNKKKQTFSKEAMKDLRKSIRLILDMYSYALNVMRTGDERCMKNVQKKKENVMLLDEKMRNAHIDRVGAKKCSVKLTGVYNIILHDIDRIGNSCVNLVEMALDEDAMQLMIDMSENPILD